MYNEVITLISESKSIDEFGDTVVVEATKDVFAELKSIGQQEFYQAQAVGLKPEVKFVIADYLDYDDEQKIRYTDFKGHTEDYRVLRTYRNENALEIVCYKGVE